MSHTPSTHGRTLGHAIAGGKLLSQFYLIGDDAYVNGPSLVTQGKDDNFNLEHFSLRVYIGCAFGECVRRWRVLWHPSGSSSSTTR